MFLFLYKNLYFFSFFYSFSSRETNFNQATFVFYSLSLYSFSFCQSHQVFLHPCPRSQKQTPYKSSRLQPILVQPLLLVLLRLRSLSPAQGRHQDPTQDLTPDQVPALTHQLLLH